MTARGANPFTTGALLAILLVMSSSEARADSQDLALAEALFDQGVELMKDGEWSEACPKLAESQRLDPAPGTLLFLADCYEKTGRLASAWATFREASALARLRGESARVELAKDRAAALEPRMPRLRIEVLPSTNASEVRLDDTVLGRPLWNTDLPVDPGEHTVRASSPGHLPRTITVRVDAEGRQRVVLSALEREGPSTTPAPAHEPRPATGDGTNARRTTWRRGLAFGTGGAGIAALGVGAFFGLRAFEEWGDSESRCPAGRCSREGVELARSAGEAATISTVAFAAGAALMAGGIVLLIMTPKARAVPHVGRGALFEAAF